MLFLIVLAFYSGVRRTPAIRSRAAQESRCWRTWRRGGRRRVHHGGQRSAGLALRGVLVAAGGFVHPTIGRSLPNSVPWHRTHSPGRHPHPHDGGLRLPVPAVLLAATQ
ncbi:MAG: hypothetical protein R2705_24745 [Ilumatobacteraceae bacterium]